MKRIFKRILAGVLTLLMLMANVWAVPSAVTIIDSTDEQAVADEAFAKLMDISGDGSEEDPFLIETEEDLMLVSDFPDCHFKLANDIALTAEDWEPLCVLTDPFSGTFDGNGHTISNLTITSDNTENGLFSENAGVIKNLNVETSTTGVYLAKYTGILVGNNSGTIEKCNVTGNIYGDSSSKTAVYVGCFTGYNAGVLRECRVGGILEANYTIAGDSFVGGFVGYSKGSNSLIEKCFASVNITCDMPSIIYSNYGYASICKYVGGFAGCNFSVITESYFNGEIALGGYCGNDMRTSTSSLSGTTCHYYTGQLTCYCGGFVGSNRGSVENSAAVSAISRIDDYATIYSNGFSCLNSSVSSTTGAVTNSYAVPSGLLTYGFGTGSNSNTFYDKTVAGCSDTTGGTPKTTAAMKMAATYTKAGWDFENTWAISKNINGGYPYLQWMYQMNEDYTPAFDSSMQAYLNLDELISMSVCYKFDNMDAVNAEAYLDSVGLLLWNAEEVPEEATIDNCDNIIAGAYYNSVLDRFETTTEGIAPKKLGDLLSFRAYYVDEDGNYTYSRLITNYSPKTYCYNQINKNPDKPETIELMAAILNYGSAAQKYLGYKADDLMNKDLPEELKIMVVK